MGMAMPAPLDVTQQWVVPKALRDKYEDRFKRIKNVRDLVTGTPPPHTASCQYADTR